MLLGHLSDHVAELVQDELLHGKSNGLFRAGDGDDDPVLIETGGSTAHHGSRADVFETHVTENFTESLQALFQ